MKLWTKRKALKRLLRVQMRTWEKSIRYELRFVLCGIFTFLAFFILNNLGKIEVKSLNWLAENAFFGLSNFMLLLFTIALGYLGLIFSIIAVALFNSLLPKT